MRRMFSENQIKKLVGESSSQIVSALTNQDLKVKTIEQSEPNWEIDVKSILNPAVFKNTDNLYCKLCLFGNELELVISGKFIAQSLSGNLRFILGNEISIPDELASKIFRADGTSLNENPSALSVPNTYICGGSLVKYTGTVGQTYFVLLSEFKKNISVNVFGLGTIAEDTECWVDLRVQLVII